MRGIGGEQVLMRIILSESRRYDRGPLFRRLLDVLREEGLAGATMFKGVAGFSQGGSLHTTMIEVAARGLPVVLEVVDTQERIDRVLPKVDALMPGGVVMIERAHVIRYAKEARPAAPPT